MEKVQHSGIREHVVQFIQNFRIVLFALLAIVIIGVVIAIVYEEVNKNSVTAVSTMVEKLDASYAALVAAKDDEEKAPLLADFESAVKQANESFKGNFANQRAEFLQGSKLYADKKYADAEKVFLTAQSIVPNSYLAPVALLSAAFCAEESGSSERAVEHLTKLTITYEKSSPLVSRAWFNLGRIAESSQKWTDARDAYQKIIDSAPNSNWTKLAKDRIIYLKAQSKL